MPIFRYKGYDASGIAVDGEVATPTIDAAERLLDSQSICLVSLDAVRARIEERTMHRPRKASPRGRRRIPDSEAAILIEDLAVMAESGVPIVEALEAVAASTQYPAAAEALRQVGAAIVEGRSISSAMAEAPRLFPTMVSDMVAVAEEGGDLGDSLHSAAAYLERSAELRKSVLQAMLYPIVLTSVAATAVCVLAFFVLPRFAVVIRSLGGEIPATTRAMLAFNELASSHPFASLCVVFAIGCSSWFAVRSPAVRGFTAKIARRTPFLGPFLRKLALARAFHSISTLILSNVPLVAALGHGASTAGDDPIRQSLLEVRRAVEQGSGLSQAMAESNDYPQTLVQMAAVGEKTGRLGSLMAASAMSLSKDADRKLKAAVSILEPVMIVVMGLIVGILTISIVAPIYSVAENMK